MYCSACGHHDASLGGTHICTASEKMRVRARPLMTRWQVLGWVVLTVIAAHLLADVTRIVVLARDRSLATQIVADSGGVALYQVLDLAHREESLENWYLLLTVAFGISYACWWAALRNATKPYGDEGRAALRHWTVVAWRLGLAVSVVLAIAASRSPSPGSTELRAAAAARMSFDRTQILLAVVHLLVVGLLVPAVRVLSNRVRELVRQPPRRPVSNYSPDQPVTF